MEQTPISQHQEPTESLNKSIAATTVFAGASMAAIILYPPADPIIKGGYYAASYIALLTVASYSFLNYWKGKDLFVNSRELFAH